MAVWEREKDYPGFHCRGALVGADQVHKLLGDRVWRDRAIVSALFDGQCVHQEVRERARPTVACKKDQENINLNLRAAKSIEKRSTLTNIRDGVEQSHVGALEWDKV